MSKTKIQKIVSPIDEINDFIDSLQEGDYISAKKIMELQGIEEPSNLEEFNRFTWKRLRLRTLIMNRHPMLVARIHKDGILLINNQAKVAYANKTERDALNKLKNAISYAERIDTSVLDNDEVQQLRRDQMRRQDTLRAIQKTRRKRV